MKRSSQWKFFMACPLYERVKTWKMSTVIMHSNITSWQKCILFQLSKIPPYYYQHTDAKSNLTFHISCSRNLWAKVWKTKLNKKSGFTTIFGAKRVELTFMVCLIWGELSLIWKMCSGILTPDQATLLSINWDNLLLLPQKALVS